MPPEPVSRHPPPHNRGRLRSSSPPTAARFRCGSTSPWSTRQWESCWRSTAAASTWAPQPAATSATATSRTPSVSWSPAWTTGWPRKSVARRARGLRDRGAVARRQRTGPLRHHRPRHRRLLGRCNTADHDAPPAARPRDVLGQRRGAPLRNLRFQRPNARGPPDRRRVFLDAYAGAAADRTHPDLSPIYADPAGLPSVLIAVGDADILLEDNLAMAARLSSAGVRRSASTPGRHGFTGHPPRWRSRARRDAAVAHGPPGLDLDPCHGGSESPLGAPLLTCGW